MWRNDGECGAITRGILNSELQAGSHSRRGYTLLEVMLALGLAVVVLGLVGMGIHVQLAVATKSRDQVEEAQLARVLLQRIADDLRNAIPFQPPKSSSSSSDSTAPSPSDTSGQAGSASSSSGTASSDTSTSSSTAPLSGGIYGTAQAIQIETVRRPRAILASLQQQTTSDPSQPARLSDIRVVSYSLGAPITVDMSQESPSSTSGTGLYRHEQDRAEFYYASQNGQTDSPDSKADLLAPEVVDLKITYYGGSGGTAGSSSASSGTASSSTTSSGTAGSGTTSGGTSTADSTANGTTSEIQWDSTQEGMLPAAVKISLSLRREVPKSVLGFGDSGKPPTVVYSLLVSLPNASVDANLTASEQEEAMPASTTDMSQQSSPLNKQKGHNPNSSKQDNPNQQKNRKPPKDPTQKKSTKPTNPINPPKPRINPQKQPINPQTKPSPTVPVTPKTPTKS